MRNFALTVYWALIGALICVVLLSVTEGNRGIEHKAPAKIRSVWTR